MGKLDQGMMYLTCACLVAGFGYHIPLCLNMAIGLCIGVFVGSVTHFIADWKKTEKEIKQLEEESKKLDLLLEYVRRKPPYDSKIPSSEGCHEQTQPSTE